MSYRDVRLWPVRLPRPSRTRESLELPIRRQIIDCHTHFYDPSRPGGVPWPGKDDKVLYRTVLPKHFREVAAPLGVTGTVVVEASPLVEDNQWLLELAKEEPWIVGIVGHLSPDSDGFAGLVARFAKNPLYRGIRVNHADLKRGLENERFLNDLKRLADADLELDLNGGPDLPAEVARAAEKVKNLRIVINHCANLKIDGKEPPADWLAGMKAAAGHDKVWCKVSALVEGASRGGEPAPKRRRFLPSRSRTLSGRSSAKTASSTAATGPSASGLAVTRRCSRSSPPTFAAKARLQPTSSLRAMRKRRISGE